MGKRKKKRRRKLRKGILIGTLLAVIAILGFVLYLVVNSYLEGRKTTIYYLADDKPQVAVIDKDGNAYEFTRGSQVAIRNKREELNEIEYAVFEDEQRLYYVSENKLTQDEKDCVRESVVYALRDHVLTVAYDDYHISGWVKAKDELRVSGYHELLSDGNVDYYQVNDTGYIKAAYVAAEYHETAYDASIYSDAYFGEGGDPTRIAYYPKEDFSPRTPMPDKVNALYINAESISLADEYIAIARETSGINAFVVDIKDCYIDTQLAYDSPAARIYAPSAYNIPNSYESYKENVGKLKAAGYYLIGRITAFKDDSFAQDNPDEALLYNDSLYTYGSVRWPSIYSRKMWEYDVALALEAAEEMGFDEIQFDYVRLPEDVEDVDLRIRYDESRAQAITSFLRYASEFLHARGIYVSADVFGETSGSETDGFSAFVSYYGQFWPAISNAADAISSMPYPDHFSYYAYGIDEPWLEPGELMYSWGRATYYAQEKTYDPAKCRTWIMAQNSDPYDVFYSADFIADQINGLRRAGVDDGYMTWNAASSISKYESYIDVLD